MPDQHAISVVMLSDGRYRATCSCGLRGIRTRDRRIAEIRVEQHLAYVEEVARMTRGEQG